jgi:hypothetical protein
MKATFFYITALMTVWALFQWGLASCRMATGDPLLDFSTGQPYLKFHHRIPLLFKVFQQFQELME